MFKLFAILCGLMIAAPAFAVGSIIVSAYLGLAAGTALSGFALITAFAINMVVSSIIAKAFFTPQQSANELSGSSPNPGNRTQVPPATDNKLPIIYGDAWVGGIITDLSITQDNQTLYYVMALSEVTGEGTDTITFGDIYYGGKKVVFNVTNEYSVDSLLDESTNESQVINGNIKIYTYSNGSNSPVNSSTSAIAVMNGAGLVYTWDGNKLMTNCAFAILVLTYNQSQNITGLEQTRFQLSNSRHKPGECFYDYLTNTVYGGAIPATQIDTDSLDVLDAYCDESFTYITYEGPSATQTRFRFDGVVDPSRSIMANMQDMASCCDCLIKYNEIMGTWGVITQKPTYTIAMALDDSNMVSAISISPLDLASSYNVIECKFPDNSNQDAFNSSTFDLAQIDPALLFPNEPVNKQSISLPLVNDSVRAQYLANRMLKSGREDLQVQVNTKFTGIQLEAGDIVTITSVNYGWEAKEFRINKVIEEFADDASVTAKLTVSEFNAAVYDDVSVTQFIPANNTGIASPVVFGSVPAPVVSAQYPTAEIPSFVLALTASFVGIIQYAEVWYSAFANPTTDQLLFAGTTAIQSNGNPYTPNAALPSVLLSDIPSGNWYFFSRMVNSLGASHYSPASSVFNWRPRTFQYTERYLSVAYADSITGTGFDLDPRGHDYYGLYNQSTNAHSTNPADYTWYLADPAFGTTIYLCYSNRTTRRFSFATGFAAYASGTGAFVPTQATIFDPTIWAALPDGTNFIDLDYATGQLLSTGTTSTTTGEIEVKNNPNGQVVASLKQFLNFGGPSQKTYSAAQITVDIYGRVVGFEAPDNFYITIQSFTATASQTVFNVTRGTGYITDQCFVFENGCLLDESEYTDASATVTLAVGATLNNTISVISFRSSTSILTTATSGTGSVATITFSERVAAPFTVGQSITVADVVPAGYNGTFTVTGATTSTVSYSNSTTGVQTTPGHVSGCYPSFSRTTANLTTATTYSPAPTSGFELLFINGTVVNEQDYDIVNSEITNFPNIVTGLLTMIQWSANNLTVPNGNPANIIANTVIGQTLYPFSYDVDAFNLYQNGVLLKQGTDYTTATGTYTLTNSPTTITNILQQQTFARTGAA
jgi:hypothetical protein